MDINISSQIVVQTAAQWAADTTVYSEKRILVTSDVYYGSTDQRKFKIADGVQTWTQLDYMPLSQTLSQVLANGYKTGEQSISSDSDKSYLEILDSRATLNYVDGLNQVSFYGNSTGFGGYFVDGTNTSALEGDSVSTRIIHNLRLDLNAPTINLPQGTANKILKLDASKNVTYVDEGLSLSGGNANQDIDVGNYSINAKSFHVKGTGGAGHLGLKHQSGNITASTSESTLGANSSGDPVWKNDGNAIQEILLKDSVNTATNYTTPLDADKVSIWDTANSLLKAVTWSNIKATLKTYFDTLYKATFTENTAFNKNFGTGTTNIVEIGSTLGNSLITSTDANGKLQTLATSTYPTLTELSYVKGLSSDVQTQLDAKRSTTTEMLLFTGSTLATNLAPSTTYYWSNMNGYAFTSTQSFSKFTFANNYTVTKAVLTCSQNTNASSANVALYIRASATTDKTITTSLDLNSVGTNTSKVFVYSGLNLSVTGGSDYELKIVTPGWTTAPTNCRWHIQLWGY